MNRLYHCKRNYYQEIEQFFLFVKIVHGVDKIRLAVPYPLEIIRAEKRYTVVLCENG